MSNPLPWPSDGGLIQQYMLLDGDDPASFFRPDLFHVYHAGVGKDFLGSSLIYCMKALFGLGGVKRDLQALNEELAVFFRVTKIRLHLGSTSTEDNLGYTGTRDYGSLEQEHGHGISHEVSGLASATGSA